MIFHAGDMTNIEVYNYLSRWNMRSVRGNMDEFNIKSILSDKRVEVIEGKRIGIIHGRGSPNGIENLVLKEFQDVDVIVFGHSHVPLNTIREGVMLFNPGSYRGTYMHPGTIGIMEIDHDDIRFVHLQVT
jgi:uncharacterized protein